MEKRLPRKLAAIVYADVAGYSRLTGEDEDATHRRLSEYLDLMASTIESNRGRVMHYAGDAVLAMFDAVVDALSCAVHVQRELESRNEDLPDGRKLQFRIGVNMGDVIEDRGDIYGDGVNVAARLESLAEPGGICISGAVYDTIGSKLPFDYGFMGEKEVKNIANRVRAYRVKLESDGTQKEVPAGAPLLRHSDEPAIAVLPFTNMSGDPEQEYFSDGITEDIITALSKNRWLSVIASNSTFAYKGQSLDVRHVADELNASYVVEGSVRKSGKRVRITAQLIDAVTGKHIWGERYDRDLEDVFAVQDEITETVAATIEPELAAVEGRRVKHKTTENLDAWDCYHLGLSHMYKFNAADNAQAQALFRRAIEIDPDFGAAHARLAYAIVISMVYFESEPTAEILDEALRIAQRAAALDDQDALAHFAVGRAHLVRSEYGLAVDELETSVKLNPCLAQAHCGLGDAMAYVGRLEESVPCFEEAVRLSPHDPYRWGFLMYGSLAHLFLKRYEVAVDWAGKAVRVPNSHYWANATLVAALGHLDRPDETRAAVEELLQRKPDFSCSFARKHLFYIKSPEQIGNFLDGLREAGLPE